MRARGFQPAIWGFTKAEGLVATGSSSTLGGNAVYFTESGAGADPGRVWALDHLGNDPFVNGRIVVQGDRYRSWVNVVPTSDFTHDVDKGGFIGLQVHGIPRDQGPYRVRWRNVRIRELKPGEEAPDGR